MRQTLNKDEIEYFYNLLFKYEHEPSYAGYQDARVLDAIGSKIEIDDNHEDDENIINEKNNCIQYHRRRYKCRAILRHVRNAFAHGNIQSVDNDSAFLIKDYDDPQGRTKCNMLAKAKKDYLYELIDVMESTRKKSSKKVIKKQKKTKK